MPQPEDYDDATILDLFKRDPTLAITCLYRKYKARLFASARVIVRDDHIANDVVNDVFVKIVRNGIGANVSADFLPQWLYKCVRHKAIDHLRKRRKSTSHVTTDSTPLEPCKVTANALQMAIDLEALHDLIEKTLSGLHYQLAVLELKTARGHDIKPPDTELAEHFGTSVEYIRKVRSEYSVKLRKAANERGLDWDNF